MRAKKAAKVVRSTKPATKKHVGALEAVLGATQPLSEFLTKAGW